VPLPAILFVASNKHRKNSEFSLRQRRKALLLFVPALLAIALCACQKPNSSSRPEAIHEITREFAAAARKSSPPGTVIRMKLQAIQKTPSQPDWLEVTIFAESDAAARKSELENVLAALGGVAERHKLRPGKRGETGAFTAISFSSGSRTTHSVEIRFAHRPRWSENEALKEDAPRLAIILDDFGNDRPAAEAVFGMPYPLTLSILPNHEHSKEIAEEALQRGYQVMLHLPMQSVTNESPEKEELKPGMTSQQVKTMLGEMIESVPNAVGVNNHQGSQATSDSTLMKELMPALLNWNLFYVDSRTTAATVAFDTAKRDGVLTAFRNVPFLDDVQEETAIRKQLELALRGAKEKKAAIAIGHPHPETLEALRKFLPAVRENGVRLVFVSELVH
jgi:polysaccharide deacetylase 2 family uncharacterized protein YibQ